MTVITNAEYARNPWNPQAAPQGPVQPTIPQIDTEPLEGVDRQSTAGAAFSRENIIGAERDRQRFDQNLATAQSNAQLDEPFDLGASIPEHLREFAQVYIDNAIDPESAQVITDRLNQQIDDDTVLHTSGVEGVAMRMVASILDPSSIPAIPLTMISKLGTLGKIVTGSGVIGGSVAAQEAFLHHSQDTRILEETNIAIGTGLLFGGILGPLLSNNGNLLAEALQDMRTAVRGQKKQFVIKNFAGNKDATVTIEPKSFRAKFTRLDCP